MTLISQRYQVSAEIEGTEGTAETLVAGDVILAFNPKFSPNIDMHKRYPGRSSLSAYPSLPGSRSAKMSFDVELVGTASAGDAVHFADVIKGCGVQETLVAGTSATYAPASSSISSLTLGLHRDGKRSRVWGARGNAKLILEFGKPGIFTFDFEGADFDVADEALLAGTSLSSATPPTCQDISLTMNSYAATLSKVEIDFGNKLATRKDANASSGNKSVVLTGREATLSFDPEDVLVATEDFFSTWRAGTEVAFTATLGSDTGNTIAVTAPKVQYHSIAETDRDGIAALEIQCQLDADSGDDEWEIEIT